MPYGSMLADVMQSSTSGTPPQFNDGNGAQIGTLCRAWVSFAGGASSATINASFNVSSVTRTGGGAYTVNFTNALADNKYAIGSCADYFGVADVFIESSLTRGNTSSAAYLRVSNGGDASSVMITVFR